MIANGRCPMMADSTTMMVPRHRGKIQAGQVDMPRSELRGLPDEETAGRRQHRGDEHSTVPLADGALKAERAEASP